MGYTQRSKITVIEADGSRRDFTEDESERFAKWSDAWDYLAGGNEGKWYDETDDLARLSAAMPGIAIECESVGEDGAQWRTFARDGRVTQTHPTLVWPEPVIDMTATPARPFDPLKEEDEDV